MLVTADIKLSVLLVCADFLSRGVNNVNILCHDLKIVLVCIKWKTYWKEGGGWGEDDGVCEQTAFSNV